MKHLLILLSLLLSTGVALSQQTEVEYNSGAGDPHVLLTETGTGAMFSRMTFQNQNPGFWTFAARTGTGTNDDDFNLFYDDGTGGINLLNIEADTEDFNITADDVNIFGGNGRTNLTLEGGANSDARAVFISGSEIWSVGSDASANHFTLAAGSSSTGSSRFFSADDEGSVGLGNTLPDPISEVTIGGRSGGSNLLLTNSGSSSPNFNNEIRMANSSTAGQFLSLEGNSSFSQFNDADFSIRYSEDSAETNSSDILTALYAWFDENGETTTPGVPERDERVGIRTTAPLTDLHLVHKGGILGHGFRLQNEGSNNRWWTWYVSNSSGTLSFRNSTSSDSFVGFFATNGNYTGSDLRLKREIENMPYGLKEILQMDAKRYHYKSDAAGAKKSIGFIAQEVDKIVPELVLYEEEADQYNLNYAGISVLNVRAIQEQQKIIENQKNIIERQQAEINIMKEQLSEVISTVASLTSTDDSAKTTAED